MDGSVLAFILCLLLCILLILASIYYLIMLTDLESDYINPVDLCNTLNKYMLPEQGFHALISIILLLSGMYYSFLLNVPMLAFNIYNYVKNKYKLDATEIFRNLNQQKLIWGCRLGFYLVSLFWYLYRLIVCLVQATNPRNKV